MANRTYTRVAHAEIPASTREQLEQLAREGDRTLAAEIRRALRAHIVREAPPETNPKENR